MSKSKSLEQANDTPFFITFFLLFCLMGILSYATWKVIALHSVLGTVFLMQSLNTLGYYLLLGFGISLPLILLATILGWLQVILLAFGSIDPHLGKEGLFKVLKTLCSIRSA